LFPGDRAEINQIFYQHEKTGPQGQVNVSRLCHGFFVFKNTNSKDQIPNKFQNSMTKTFQTEKMFGLSNFGYLNLFDNWNLMFVISISE